MDQNYMLRIQNNPLREEVTIEQIMKRKCNQIETLRPEHNLKCHINYIGEMQIHFGLTYHIMHLKLEPKKLKSSSILALRKELALKQCLACA